MGYDGSIKIDTKIDNSGFERGFEKMKTIAERGVSAVTTSLAAISGGIIAGGTAAARVGSSFEAGMSKVSAISGATGEALQLLTDKAKEMGAKTKFSASESAQALQYMSMAGWDTESMLNGIDGIMSLAAADGLDLATTSDIVTDAITAFGLKASDSSHFADVLAKASSSANTNVSMLGESFKYVAPLAGTMGYSAEDVSVALGLMANASVKGSMAGTSLKTALSNLASPTQAMAGIMSQYGISISDAQGNALPLIDVLKQLREKFGGLSETEQAAAASTLFGKEAMSGMLAIINASDSDFNKLTENIYNADGAAQSMADTMQDNLQGQITILKSALEGLGIEIYEGMSEPLKDAAVEAQNYVNRLTDAFKEGGLSGLIEEAGNIFGELAVRAAEEAPKMVDAAIGFLQSFINGIANNSGKLIEAAKSIIKSLANGFVKLLPSEIQKPVKETVEILQKSFQSGGLRKSIETVRNIITNLGKAVTNVAKVVLPPLAKAVDFVAGNFKTLLPIVTSVYAAYKSYQIISTLTALFKAHTAAVTAESLAEAASLGTITLKQIAVGALTGEITLATAAQYAWNLAMSMNPIGLVVMAVSALIAGVAALAMTMGDSTDSTSELEAAQASLEESNQKLGESYDDVSNKFNDFASKVQNAGSVFDNFNENILISDEEKQALSDNMDSVQSEISEICRRAADERRELTGSEIERLDELFQKMHELTERELEMEVSKQQAVLTQAEGLRESSQLTLEEYTNQSEKLMNTAEETRQAVMDKAYEQWTEELALLNQKKETQANYSDEEYQAEKDAAEQRYLSAIDAANKEAGDTLAVIQQGYYDRADLLRSSTEELKELNTQEENEKWEHSAKIKSIDDQYNRDLEELKNKGYNTSLENVERDKLLSERKQKLEEEDTRHTKEQAEIRNNQNKIMNDENYQNQVSAFAYMEALYETYTGKVGEKSTEIVNAFNKPMQNLPEDTRNNFANAMKSGLDTMSNYENSFFNKAANIAGSIANVFRTVWDIHSPSRLFKKIFGQAMQGGGDGVDEEAPNLYKKSNKVANTFAMRMKIGLDKSDLIAKMRAGIDRGKALVAQTLSAKVVHDVDISSENNNRKVVLKGDIKTAINIDGRETAIALTPYVSEELAYEEVFV